MCMCTRVSLSLSIKCIWFLFCSMHLEHIQIAECTNASASDTHANETRTTVVLPVELLEKWAFKIFHFVGASRVFRPKKEGAHNISSECSDEREIHQKNTLSQTLAPFTFYSLIFRIMHFVYVITFNYYVSLWTECTHVFAFINSLTHYFVDLWFTGSKMKWNERKRKKQI